MKTRNAVLIAAAIAATSTTSSLATSALSPHKRFTNPIHKILRTKTCTEDAIRAVVVSRPSPAVAMHDGRHVKHLVICVGRDMFYANSGVGYAR